MSIKSFATRGAAARMVAAAVVAVSLAGCAEEQSKGYVLSESALQQVQVGASQEQVLVVLGTPSTTATLKGDAFYYISQKTRRPVQFMNPSISEQRVLAIYFDKNRRVEKIANYGLKDGRVFDFLNQVTPTAGQDTNFIEHMFKGLLSDD